MEITRVAGRANSGGQHAGHGECGLSKRHFPLFPHSHPLRQLAESKSDQSEHTARKDACPQGHIRPRAGPVHDIADHEKRGEQIIHGREKAHAGGKGRLFVGGKEEGIWFTA